MIWSCLLSCGSIANNKRIGDLWFALLRYLLQQQSNKEQRLRWMAGWRLRLARELAVGTSPRFPWRQLLWSRWLTWPVHGRSNDRKRGATRRPRDTSCQEILDCGITSPPFIPISRNICLLNAAGSPLLRNRQEEHKG